MSLRLTYRTKGNNEREKKRFETESICIRRNRKKKKWNIIITIGKKRLRKNQFITEQTTKWITHWVEKSHNKLIKAKSYFSKSLLLLIYMFSFGNNSDDSCGYNSSSVPIIESMNFIIGSFQFNLVYWPLLWIFNFNLTRYFSFYTSAKIWLTSILLWIVNNDDNDDGFLFIYFFYSLVQNWQKKQ